MLPFKTTSRVLDVRLQTITPVHIGTGNTLMKDYDFIDEAGQTRRINVDQLLTDVWDESLSRRANVPKPAELLKGASPEELVRYTAYVAQGVVRASASGSQLQEQLKNTEFEPYIPGSSLKGALRTALGWAGWPEVMTKPLDPERHFGRTPKFAGQFIEDVLFRPNKDRSDGPNKDVMRALQVGDMHVTRFNKGYLICNVQVASSGKYDSPIEVEALSDEARFRGQWTLHEDLFEASVLGLAERKIWLDDIAARVNQHSIAQLNWLRTHFADSRLDGSREQVAFCEQLIGTINSLQPNQCVLRLGWGGGWDNKTFSSRLSEAPASDLTIFERDVIRKYNVYRGKRQRTPGDPFPTTRRVIVRDIRGQMKIQSMFGWVLLQLKPVDR